MLVIEYGPGEAVSDFEVEELYNRLTHIASEQVDLFYSTANIFDRIRLGIALDEIDCQQVVFVWKGEYLSVNEYGALEHWPEGFLDQAWFAADILEAALAKRKRSQ